MCVAAETHSMALFGAIFVRETDNIASTIEITYVLLNFALTQRKVCHQTMLTKLFI